MSTAKTMYAEDPGPPEMIPAISGAIGPTRPERVERRAVGRRRRPEPSGRHRTPPAAPTAASASALTSAINSLEPSQAQRHHRLPAARHRSADRPDPGDHRGRERVAGDGPRLADPHQARRRRRPRSSRPRSSPPTHRTLQYMDIRQFITKLTPKGWAMVGGSARGRDRVPDPDHALRLRAELLDAAHRARSRRRPARSTSTLSAKGIGYQIQNSGTALAVDAEPDEPGADRAGHRRACSASAASSPASSCSNSSAARRLELPAAGHLPARARGPARPDDRADPGRRLRHREPRAARTSRTSCSATAASRPAPRCCCPTPAALDPSAVKGIAQLVASSVQGLSDQTRSRSPTRAARCCGRPRARTPPAAATTLAAGGRPAVRLDDGRGGRRRCSPRRSAPGKAQVVRSTPT